MSVNNRGKKILLVDDDQALRTVLAEQLDLYDGFTTIQVSTAAEGLEKAKLAHYDAILLDIGLPDMDGRELCKLMRREGVYSSSLSTWRRQREAADLAALAPQKRGPKPDPHRAESLHIAQLTRERDRLKSELCKAMLVIDVQKKLAALLGNPIDDTGDLR